VKFVIAGAGAIGAYIGARMAQKGQDVVLFARGPHFRAMKENGVRVQTADEDFVVRPEIVDDLAKAGTADFVFLGVKAHSLTDLAPKLGTLVGPQTTFVSTQNGIPWWYFQKLEGELAGTPLERIDPGGVIARSIEADRVIGSIIYFSTEISQPGVVKHIDGNRISLGEPDCSRSDRIRVLAEALIAAGFKAPITTRIREEIWVKILGNLSFNPISALTGATLVGMVRDPDVAELVKNIMTEATAVAAKIGIEMPVSIERRMEGAAKIGEHKTSMLQDLEAGRPIRARSYCRSCARDGRSSWCANAAYTSVYACTKLLDKMKRGR
jgi:2-dehydropantoate 2-reductase